MLEQDPDSRVACETLIKANIVVLAGEVRSNARVNLDELCRQVIRDIGYTSAASGFNPDDCTVVNALGQQSGDIAMGVDETADHEQGAGDQGLMFGYATNETDVLMPAPLTYAHRLMQRQAEVRRNGAAPFLRPDAKSQVTLRYGPDGQPTAVDAVVLSTQHDPDVSQKDLHEAVREEIIKPVLPGNWMTAETKVFINPTGKFVVGGPAGDCGLTGRKIIVDTYGGMARHGGGAFSGKDPTKVDRSASYAARYLAKNVVAAGVAERCTIQVAYAIGVSKPLAVCVDTHATGQVDEAKLARVLQDIMDLRPRGIREHLGLNRPIYARTAAYGHFGREPEPDGGFSWERTDIVEQIKGAF
jgi:S-adenosylmethionine synthetase